MFRIVSKLLLVLAALSSVSCEILYNGAGDLTIEQYIVSEIRNVIFDDIFEVYYVPDTTRKLLIEGGKNQLKTVTVKESGGKLTISNTIKLQALRDYNKIKVFLYSPTLDTLIFTEAGSFTTTDTLRTNSFCFQMEGDMGNAKITLKVNSFAIAVNDANGNYNINGIANYSRINNRGAAEIDARNLKSKKTECYQLSLGNCHTQATDELYYEIRREGNIYQYGNCVNIDGIREGEGKFYTIK